MNKKIKIIGLVAISILTINLKALADEIKTFKLPNNHTVIIQEVHANPIVTIDTWIKTGSINETPQNNGVSHFLEHLFFKGTNKYKVGEIDKFIESKGGISNAATSKDFTHYYTTIASPFFEEALEKHANMLLNPSIPQDEMDKERKVVIEEIGRSLDNKDRIIFENLNKMLFKQHPYKYTVLGPAENIATISRAEVFKYYNNWYKPSNMTTIVIGDINTDNALKLVQENFKDNSGKKISTKKYKREPNITQYTENIEKGDYNSGYMVIGIKGVPITNLKDNYALDLAATILGSGKSSRLNQHIKEKGLVSSISAGHSSMKDDSIFYIKADFKPKRLDEVKNAIFDELTELSTSKVAEEELSRAKNMLQREFIYGNESVSNIANSLGYSVTISGGTKYHTNFIEELSKLTADDVLKACKKYIKKDKMAVSILLPDTKSVSFIKEQKIDENITKTVLDNGMTVLLDKNTSNDIISASVMVKGGNLAETKPGISSLIAQVLKKGTKNRSSVEIANELENSGIIISPKTNSDYFEIRVKSTKADFDKAIAILTDIINNPLFEEQEIAKAKKNILQNIKISRDKPIRVAFEEFVRGVYPDHKYGNTGKTLEKSIPEITRGDVESYYNDIFIPENMVIATSGNIENKELVNKFSKLSENKKGKKIENIELVKGFNFQTEQKIIPVEKNVKTAWLFLGWPTEGISNDKDFATLKVINGILGGGMSSRLFVNLREKQGLAYEISSICPSKMDKSFFAVYLGTNPKNLKLAKNEFLREISRIKTEKVDDKELENAKQKIIGRFALSQETNSSKAHNIAWFEAIDKGYKFNKEYLGLINSVTSDDIINTANKYFNDEYTLSVIAPAKYLKEIR